MIAKLRRKLYLRLIVPILAIVSAGAIASCGIEGDQFEQSWTGVSATIHTYNENGKVMDTVHGRSLRITRDTDFDQVDSTGEVTKQSSVLLISIGRDHMSHVGSSLVAAEDGLTDIMFQTGSTFDVDNSKFGVPWLNDIKYRYQNYFVGKSRIIAIRSQNGTPIAVFSGNKVQTFATEVPTSTWYKIDGKMLFVYRADLTVYDTALIQR